MSAKLKLLERKLGLAPKEFPPMSPTMERIARRQAPEPDDLDAVEQPHPRMKRLMDEFGVSEPVYDDYRQIPPTPTTPAPVDRFEPPVPVARTPAAKPAEYTSIWHRDGAGKISWCETVANGVRFITVAERDGAGAIVRTTTTTDGETPVPPPVIEHDPRAYNPGEPR
jgi:hypothetical protein